MRHETEQTSTRGADVERACSGYSSHRKPGEKLHLLVGSVTWAHLTAETPRGKKQQSKGERWGEWRGPYTGGIIFLHITATADTSCSCSFPIPSVPQAQASAGSRHSPAQSQQVPPAPPNTCKARMRTKGNQMKLFAEATKQQKLNNLANLHHHKRESVRILRILYHQCLV